MLTFSQTILVLNLDPGKHWKYQSNNSEHTVVVLLIRQKADENTVQSSASCYEIVISSKDIVQPTN